MKRFAFRQDPDFEAGLLSETSRGRAGTRTRARGFTLIEVLAAIVLVGIVVPIAMDAISLAMRQASDAKRKVEAAMLAENKLTELSTGLVMQSTGGALASGGAMSGDFAPDWPDYRWEADRMERDVDLAELQVRVSWISRGADRYVSVSTFAYTGTTTASESGGFGGTSAEGGAP